MVKTLTVYILTICLCALANAQNDSSLDSPPLITPKVKVTNFAIVYTVQWTYYLIVHKKEIKKYGSFENWINYPRDPHYDRDGFEYNLFRHTFAGQYYYLFYRSRNYSEQNAFIWSALSSFVFEFTIETVTERPSYQDLYQTPVYGTVLGVGIEKISNYLHETKTSLGHLFAYILNPFTLIPPTNSFFGTAIVQSGQIVLHVGWEFE